MLSIQSVQPIPLQGGDGRQVRLVLQPTNPQEHDPFIILADDQFAHNTFADHPHKGIQTVTYVIDGSLEHYDSKTNGGGRLNPGDFQIMTAGRGIIHNENPDPGQEARVLQLWVNLSSEHKKVDGQYEDLAHVNVPFIEFDGGKIEVYAGEMNGVKSPMKLFTPFTFAAVTVENGASELIIPAEYNSYIYVLEGSITVQDQTIQTHNVVRFDSSSLVDSISFSTTSHAKFVVFAGLPIKEPIAARGPFVMNTEEEIKEAYASYRNGTFLDGVPY
ncbi:pirin family protein [Solibacillus sp. FSL K6-1523]|uniref:pirin family protein n=1 Tax=Solibacillus sp. FSL K6-1523 TaxID=2921471 RepID=UPI0030F8BC82